MSYFNATNTVQQAGAYDAQNLAGLQQMSSSNMMMGAGAQSQMWDLERQQRDRERFAASERSRIASQQQAAATVQRNEEIRAAKKKEETANLMQQTFQTQREEVKETLTPWRETGAQAVQTLAKKVDEGPGEYTKSPGYECPVCALLETIMEFNVGISIAPFFLNCSVEYPHFAK